MVLRRRRARWRGDDDAVARLSSLASRMMMGARMPAILK